MKHTYDAIVLGAGQAGYPLSVALARAGWRTALVEREHVGGTCVNEGCTPTKTMVASARAAYLARRATDYGLCTVPVTVNMAAVREHKRGIVHAFMNGARDTVLATDGLDFYEGEARFTGPHAVAVQMNAGGTEALEAPKLFINTGARPALPHVEGLDGVPVLDSTSIMELDTVPEHLLVLGGGYIGLEFGQMFRRFGSAVTIVQRSPQLLPREDTDLAAAILEILQEDGVTVLLEAHAMRAAQDSDGRIRLVLQTPDGTCEIAGSHLLAAAGRVPNTERLDLPTAGITVDGHGFIPVDDRLETAVPGLYALGDVKGGPAFTHVSYDDFRIVRSALLGGPTDSLSRRLLPYTVFIDPQLGRVGLTEVDARAQGKSFRVARLPMSRVARAVEMSETRGFMKALVEDGTGQLLGAAVLGLEGGEIATLFQVAMMGGLPFTALRDAVFSHPTLAEALNTLFTHGFEAA